jgi:ubiquitin-protein ligase
MDAKEIIRRKRFEGEKKILEKNPLHYSTAYPAPDDSLTWYCLIIGQKGTPYYGGQYIYKVVHSPDYPAKPPDYYFLTPSGRYEVNKKICLTNSSYHAGEWSSSWNIQTILISFYSIFLDNKEHGISHITNERWSESECIRLAKESIEYNKKHHAAILALFNTTHLSDEDPPKPVAPSKPVEESKKSILIEEVKAEPLKKSIPVEEIKPVEEPIKRKIVRKKKIVDKDKDAPIAMADADDPVALVDAFKKEKKAKKMPKIPK